MFFIMNILIRLVQLTMIYMVICGVEEAYSEEDKTKLHKWNVIKYF